MPEQRERAFTTDSGAGDARVTDAVHEDALAVTAGPNVRVHIHESDQP